MAEGQEAGEDLVQEAVGKVGWDHIVMGFSCIGITVPE